MKLLADVHISPRTVTFLRGLGHDVVRVGSDYLRSTASECRYRRCGDRRLLRDRGTLRSTRPSVVLLRLVTAKIETVNDVLERALPMIEIDLAVGALVTVEEHQVRIRRLPIA
jgi:predicted nuclease of predicted toxin-antitoxin system